jgi:predicted PurR-regulated permease PerM
VAAWRLSAVLLLGFAGVLLAVLFRNLACEIAHRTGLPVLVSLALAVSALVGALAVLAVTTGPRLGAEFGELVRLAPGALFTVEQELRTTTGWGDWLFSRIEEAGDPGGWNVVGRLGGLLTAALTVAANLIVLLTVAVFLAVNPGLYRRGLLHLVPLGRRARAEEVLDALTYALWRWLLGQGLSMLFVGVCILAGLWAIGIPLAFVLAAIAALTNFVPFLGPFLGAVPALLMAVPEGPNAVLWTAALFLVVQQFDGNVFTPLIQKQATSLPPVLIVLGVAAAGLLFGLPGVFLATPLLLVGMVLVRMLYVEDVLGDEDAQGPEAEAAGPGAAVPADRMPDEEEAGGRG